jgi:hypothetical protein
LRSHITQKELMSAGSLVVVIVSRRRFVVTVLGGSGLMAVGEVIAGQDAACRNTLRACHKDGDS